MRWLFVVAFVASCGKSESVCKTEVADLTTFLQTMDHSASLLTIPGDLHLVDRPDLGPSDGVRAFTVFVRPHRLELEGMRIELDDLASKLADDGERAEHSSRAAHRLDLVIDRDAPWSMVTAVARAAATGGVTSLVLVFSKPSTVVAPPRSSVSDQVDQIIANSSGIDTAVEASYLLKGIVKSCAPIDHVFGDVAGVEPTHKADTLLAGIGPALTKCHCDLDMPALRSALFAMLANLHPLTQLVITLDKAAPAITLPPTTLWRDAAGKLVGGPAWLP